MIGWSRLESTPVIYLTILTFTSYAVSSGINMFDGAWCFS